MVSKKTIPLDPFINKHCTCSECGGELTEDFITIVREITVQYGNDATYGPADVQTTEYFCSNECKAYFIDFIKMHPAA